MLSQARALGALCCLFLSAVATTTRSGAATVTTTAAPSSAVPRSFADLSPSDRAILPDNTAVIFGKDNGTTTLGHLRTVHAALVASRAYAAGLHHPNLFSRVYGLGAGGPVVPIGSAFGGPTLASAAPPAPNANDLMAPVASNFKTPSDAAAACAGATLCLYFPAGIAMQTTVGGPASGSGVSEWLNVEDPMEPYADCIATGGIPFATPSCVYFYAAISRSAFVPGRTGFQLFGACPSPVTGDVDPHGSVTVDDSQAIGQGLTAPIFCYLKIAAGA